ncbi:MAG: 4Fe-4S binding protein [Burkholderiaceae bacterium]|jgi:ferredoxin|nr:4Fe-4S binding protein [Burkholderiaceae bacterium]
MPSPPAALPVINPARCTGCGWCVAACPPHVLSLQVQQWRKTSVLDDPAGCTGCARCAVRCPFGAIRMRREAL